MRPDSKGCVTAGTGLPDPCGRPGAGAILRAMDEAKKAPKKTSHENFQELEDSVHVKFEDQIPTHEATPRAASTDTVDEQAKMLRLAGGI